MSGDHHHHHDHARMITASARHTAALVRSFALLLAFCVVEVVAARVTSSLSLLSDAAHMLTDVTGLGMALASIHVAGRAATGGGRTFGLYRLEILAALGHAVLLLGVAGYIGVEAVLRLDREPDVLSLEMLAVGLVGLNANLLAWRWLRAGASESLNMEGAYLEVLADTIGSVGVVVAAVVIQFTGWQAIDAIVGVAIGLWVLPRSLRLGWRALRILLQAAPAHIDVAALRSDLAAVDGVVDVHDLHVWTLSSGMEVATAHLMVAGSADNHGVLDAAAALLRDRYRLDHATLQVEPEDHRGCDELRW